MFNFNMYPMDLRCANCGARWGTHNHSDCLTGGTSFAPLPTTRAEGIAVFNAEQPAPASALDVQVAGSHYKNLKIQPIEYIHANGIPFAEGNVIKYVSRWRTKGGIKDLEKAKHFIELLIELESRA